MLCYAMLAASKNGYERKGSDAVLQLTRVKVQRVGVNLPEALASIAGLQRHPCQWQVHLLCRGCRCW